MKADTPTRVIEADELQALVEESRNFAPVPRAREGSALRGLAQVAALAFLVRELVRWLFF